MIIWLNSVPSTNYNITVSGVQRLLLPARSPHEMSIPGRPGTYEFGEPDVGKTEFKITCHFEPMSGKTLLETAQAIALWLSDAKTLILGDQPGIVWAGRVLSAVVLDNMVALGKFSFTFSAQPDGEAVDASTANINTATNFGSMKPFAPVITITMTATASSLQVRLVSTGQFVKVTYSLLVGDVVVFDMGRGLVTRNGSSVMGSVTKDSRFFLVPIGTQTIQTTPASGLTGQITYKKRYP